MANKVSHTGLKAVNAYILRVLVDELDMYASSTHNGRSCAYRKSLGRQVHWESAGPK